MKRDFINCSLNALATLPPFTNLHMENKSQTDSFVVSYICELALISDETPPHYGKKPRFPKE